MKKIDSFQVDHSRLKRGIYVSRKDTVGSEILTSFDIRTKLPNVEPAMEIEAMHTMEHLCATFLRNHDDWAKKTVYFGPMGCCTGFYMIFHGDYVSKDVVGVIQEMFKFMSDFNEEIPGAGINECGNYKSHDLEGARQEAKKFYKEVLSNLKEENLNYPE
ncbi:S-ribosylhomocysteine lyase [Ancylomarina sp. 16SWW S1-10-2]|uniref:S-ribosylhomocysteine lyase n=1 Tax=Ancylomarina sp. 16SWW S1-10-2 TaxID=2499681 RepID=UPI0012AE707F|nr:S-ribosylhomocysteine lyase [Ancylomarina sp. 16SWW S1-10-2]MRT94233.1 S-ribosylhomocysteine lyase [Ancylomarina sp. 16SWW S1-10-2]